MPCLTALIIQLHKCQSVTMTSTWCPFGAFDALRILLDGIWEAVALTKILKYLAVGLALSIIHALG